LIVFVIVKSQLALKNIVIAIEEGKNVASPVSVWAVIILTKKMNKNDKDQRK